MRKSIERCVCVCTVHSAAPSVFFNLSNCCRRRRRRDARAICAKGEMRIESSETREAFVTVGEIRLQINRIDVNCILLNFLQRERYLYIYGGTVRARIRREILFVSNVLVYIRVTYMKHTGIYTNTRIVARARLSSFERRALN